MGAAEKFEVGDVVYRHGDVLLKKAETVKLKGVTASSVLFHKGENHHHRLKGGAFRLRKVGEREILQVVKPTMLVHEEHGPIQVAAGTYEKDIQLEYSHWLEESRRVID